MSLERGLKKIYFIILPIVLLILTNSCSKTDSTPGEKVLIETDPNKKARDFADKGGGIFGDINKKSNSGTNFEFASSNVLWRATLKSLDFLPLVNADYSGGIIIYDWYSEETNSSEQIKVTVRFLSNEVRSDSIEITTHKKICDENNKCKISKTNENLNRSIKDKIIVAARSLKIEETKNKN